MSSDNNDGDPGNTPRGYGSTRKGVRGEAHHAAKLDWEKVRAIRASGESLATLAARYGVSRMTVQLVRQGHTWKDPDYVPPVTAAP